MRVYIWGGGDYAERYKEGERHFLLHARITRNNKRQ